VQGLGVVTSQAVPDKQALVLGRLRVGFEGSTAVVSVERDDAQLVCRLSHETPAQHAGLRERVQSAMKSVPTSTVAADLVSVFEGTLQAQGLSVALMPEADAKITIHLDAHSGRTVTRMSVVEGGMPLAEGLHRDLARRAAETIRRALRGSIGGLREALKGDDAQTFINATPQELAADSIGVFEALVMEAAARADWADKTKTIYFVAADTALKAGWVDVARGLAERASSMSGGRDDLDFNVALLVGACFATQGNLASAKLTFETALKRWPRVDGESRAWGFHNLASVAFSMGDIDAGTRAFASAAQLRGASGKALEPAKTLALAAHQLEHFNPFAALAQYDQALASLAGKADTPPAPELSQVRGEIEFARGRLLLDEAGQPQRALEAFRVAAGLLGPILEEADTYVSVLLWQAHCHSRLGQAGAAAAILGERKAFSVEAGDLRSARIEAAFGGASAATPSQAEQGAAAFREASAMVESDLPKALQLLEQAAEAEGSSKRPDSGLQAMLLSFGAHGLWKAGNRDDAIRWQRRAAQLYPGSTAIRSTLAAFLLSAGKYETCHEEACKLAEEFAVLPHGHFYAGMSSHRTGAYADAVIRLETAKGLGAVSVDAVLDDAKAQLGKEPGVASLASIGAQKLASSAPPVTHMQFLEMLRHAARRIENNSDVFWKSRKERRFKESPEGIGKALLVQDLSRDPACRLYNEVQLSGGRMDVTVNVYGTEYVLELKMCGGSYSKAYAENGFEQLENYMKARGVTRAYLVVFDGRVMQSGAAGVPAEHELAEGRRIFCVSCNVLGIDSK
jgi:tetratricopeptide (TPR) repeat protein